MGLKKVSFSTRLYKRRAFSHFFIRDWEALHSKYHFCGKTELFTHILDCQPSPYTQLECVTAPRFTNMWLLFSAAIHVSRCASKYAFFEIGGKIAKLPSLECESSHSNSECG